MKSFSYLTRENPLLFLCLRHHIPAGRQQPVPVISLLTQCQPQFCPIEQFVEPRNGVVRDGGRHRLRQQDFTPSIGCGYRIQQNMTTQVH
ncbi:hypothetical protein GZ301_001394 [Salmonella enterica]|nr:hypothetical protein [Salmonella enterica]EDW0130527.1 hypothetical protein [Salmonella enterica subsp. enterica serovar Woodinville]EDZ0905922.1 hypothetical protein [Salmonella enterica]EEH6627279.1 hypothetical protein [Salmonella enterica]EEP1336732.1 hypothetical protein [Salmonella enterica]